MAKTTGLAITTVSIDDSGGTPRDIRNDITNFEVSTPRAVQDATGVDQSGISRLLLLADCSVTFNGVFNPAATTTAHAVFRTVPSTSVARTTSLGHGGVSLAPEIFYTDYQLTRPQSGEFTWQAPGVLADGVVPTWS